MSDIIDDMRVDLRRHRAEQLAAFVMQIIAPHLCNLEDRDSHREAHQALLKEFYNAGIETFTDRDRAANGLPPRDRRGWTPHELLALEHSRLEAMMRPIPVVIPASKPA